MKLNKETLKRIIKEELDAFMSETKIRPIPPEAISDDQLGKVHGMIDDGDGEYAQQFIDAFGGSPDYVDKLTSADEIPIEAQLDIVGEKYRKAIRDLQSSRNDADEEKYNAMAQAHEREASDALDVFANRQYPDNPKQQRRYRDYGFQNWLKKYHPGRR